MTLAGAMLVMLALPSSRNFSRQPDWLLSLRAMARHLKNPRLLATYLCGFTILFSHVGLFSFVNFYLARPPFLLSTWALWLIFLVYALGIVITPLSGRLIDRMGHRAGVVLAVALVIAGIVLTLASNLAILIFGLAVASSGVFVAQSSASSHIGRAAAEARSA